MAGIIQYEIMHGITIIHVISAKQNMHACKCEIDANNEQATHALDSERLHHRECEGDESCGHVGHASRQRACGRSGRLKIYQTELVQARDGGRVGVGAREVAARPKVESQ